MEKKELNMKKFTATKTVKATPMTRTDAEKFLGRSITPADPKAEEGYLLLYPDGLLLMVTQRSLRKSLQTFRVFHRPSANRRGRTSPPH